MDTQDPKIVLKAIGDLDIRTSDILRKHFSMEIIDNLTLQID